MNPFPLNLLYLHFLNMTVYGALISFLSSHFLFGAFLPEGCCHKLLISSDKFSEVTQAIPVRMMKPSVFDALEQTKLNFKHS